MSAGEFLAMGGYGFYVWGSYIVAVVAIAIEVAAVRARLNAARRMSNRAQSSP
jgi:heme exporter protein D